MPRTRRAATVADPEAEDDQQPEPGDAPELEAVVDELSAALDEAELRVLTALTYVTYEGPRAEQRPVPMTVTINVPDDPNDRDYERSRTDGTTYTLHRGIPAAVEDRHVGFLLHHPAHRIAGRD